MKTAIYYALVTAPLRSEAEELIHEAGLDTVDYLAPFPHEQDGLRLYLFRVRGSFGIDTEGETVRAHIIDDGDLDSLLGLDNDPAVIIID